MTTMRQEMDNQWAKLPAEDLQKIDTFLQFVHSKLPGGIETPLFWTWLQERLWEELLQRDSLEATGPGFPDFGDEPWPGREMSNGWTCITILKRSKHIGTEQLAEWIEILADCFASEMASQLVAWDAATKDMPRPPAAIKERRQS